MVCANNNDVGKTSGAQFPPDGRSPARTLSSDEIAAIRANIIEGMRDLGYELRV